MSLQQLTAITGHRLKYSTYLKSYSIMENRFQTINGVIVVTSVEDYDFD